MTARSPAGVASITRRATARNAYRRVRVSCPIATGPNNSDNSPAARRRDKSIWKKRSCACAYPVAYARSEREFAVMTGTPRASRSIVTAAASDGAAAEPSSCGRLCRMAHHAPPKPSTASSATTSKVIRSQRSALIDSVLGDAQDRERVGAARDAGELALRDDDHLTGLHELELQQHRQDRAEQFLGAHFRDVERHWIDAAVERDAPARRFVARER